jgi:D-tyrosyl-tRNA(Tyr) deacylase
MIAVIQRVTNASVEINQKIRGKIGRGLMILVGFEDADNAEDIDWMAAKIANMRIFNDDAGVMNINVRDHGGEVLVVSQFTLHASLKKGNRPSYLKAAKPDIAIPLYNTFISVLQSALGKPVETGEFGADMKVSLINDGPVTIIADSKNRT